MMNKKGLGFKSMFIGLVLCSLFFYAMLSFGNGISLENNSNSSILNNPDLNKTFIKLNSNLSSFQGISQVQREKFENELPTQGFGTLVIFNLIGSGRIFFGASIGLVNIIFASISKYTGIDPIVIGSLISILLFVGIFALWKTYKTGVSD